MKTLFDESRRDEVIDRVNLLTEDNKPLWGKMNIYQMTKHCTIWNEWVLGKNNVIYKQELLGRVFGKMALKSIVKDDKPMQEYASGRRIFDKEKRR